MMGYVRALNLSDTASKLFEVLIACCLQNVLRDEKRRNALFSRMVHPTSTLNIDDEGANQQAVKYAQGLHFNQGHCSFIDSSRYKRPMSKARRHNPRVSDEFQVFYPSPHEGADVVCFGSTAEQKEVAILVQAKFLQDTAPRAKLQDAIGSTRPENLKLEQPYQHPSIRILCIWPSSGDLASHFRTMVRAAPHYAHDYFILLPEPDMEELLWDPETAKSLREFKTVSREIEKAKQRPEERTEQAHETGVGAEDVEEEEGEEEEKQRKKGTAKQRVYSVARRGRSVKGVGSSGGGADRIRSGVGSQRTSREAQMCYLQESE